uniref:Cyclin-dependent kinase inhibitor 1C-like n=1 Tax=Meloidogyne hapla TaxID=6305 RepID=A0A1I8BPI8_MELHA
MVTVASNICAHPGRYFVTAPARQLLPIAAPPMPAFIPPALPAALVPPSCVPVIQPSAAAMPAVAVTRTPLLPMPLLNAPYTAAALPAPPIQIPRAIVAAAPPVLRASPIAQTIPYFQLPCKNKRERLRDIKSLLIKQL